MALLKNDLMNKLLHQPQPSKPYVTVKDPKLHHLTKVGEVVLPSCAPWEKPGPVMGPVLLWPRRLAKGHNA